MNNKLPIIDILKESILFFRQNIFAFLSALKFPFIISFLIGTYRIFGTADSARGLQVAVELTSLLLSVWSFNLCCRVAINGSSSSALTSNEARSFFRFLAIIIFLTVINLVGMLVLTIAEGLRSDSLAFITAIAATISCLYVFIRFSLVFPPSAVGIATNLCRSWDLTEDNDWRIIVLMCAPLLVVCTAFALGYFIGDIFLKPTQHMEMVEESPVLAFFVSVVAQIIGFIMLSIYATTLSRAYQFLKPFEKLEVENHIDGEDFMPIESSSSK